MIGLLIVAWIAAVALRVSFGQVNPLFVAAILWNLVSYRRIAETQLWFLHAAPYLTILGFYAVFWGAAASEGAYQTGLPWRQALIPYAGLVGLLAWPAATGLLSLYEGRRA